MPTKRSPPNPQRQLWRAVTAGDGEGVARAVANGADINLPGDEGFTAIAHLALDGQADALRAAFAAGADPHWRSPEGLRTLCQMAIYGKGRPPESKREILSSLIEAGASPLAPDADGDDALSAAIQVDDLGSLRFLAAHAKTLPGELAALSLARNVVLATSRSKPGALHILLEAGGDPNTTLRLGWGAPGRTGHSCLQIAILHDDLPSLRALLDHGADALSPMHFSKDYYCQFPGEHDGALAVAKLMGRDECETALSIHLERRNMDEAAGPGSGKSPAPRV